MTRPHHYLVRMLLFLGAVGGVGFMLFMSFRDAFMANPALNGLIVGVLFIGVLYNFSQVIRLYPEVTWIENFRDSVTNSEARARHAQSAMPKLLAPMAAMVGDRDRFALSTAAMRTLLDGIASRLDESRDTSRYTIGLLIFLGLLGTFWGLLGTVSSISDVIGTLSVNGGEAGAIFAELKRGLQAPMEGMGTAFSSSLFGLAGSLVLGVLDWQANRHKIGFTTILKSGCRQ